MSDQELNSKIIHDIRNQLSGITTPTGLFLDGLLGELTEEQKKYILLINEAANNIRDLIQQIK